MSADSELTLMRSGERKRDHEKAALELVLENPSESAKKPRLGDHHPRLHANARNRVAGSVNGVACHVLLDSGSNFTSISWNTAKEMGLITGAEATTTRESEMWDGPQVLQVVNLQSVTICLENGVEVVTPVTVMPKSLGSHYDPGEVVLDAHQLRRGRVVQVFRRDGSELFVRRPERLLRGVHRTQQSFSTDVLKVREAHTSGREPMTMLVDTGADHIFVSDSHRGLLMQGDKNSGLPSRVRLDIGDGCHLRAEPLELVHSEEFDFIMGIVPLGEYSAVLDYAAHSLTFRVGSQWRKVQMQPR